MKEVIISSTSKVQENGTNFFATIPLSVRSVLNTKKGDELEFIIFSDRSVEVRIKEKE